MGDTKISVAYFGEKVVQKMYLGTNLVYNRLPQLATPSNLSISNYTLSFDAVENATSYEVFADNSSIGVSTKVSVDLTTLSGWSSLSAGSHNITVVAKADGYRDSEPSAAVSVTKGAEEYTDCITFTGESSDFTLSIGGAKEWNGTVEYSTDHNTWTEWDGSEISSSGQKLYLRGSGNTTFSIDYGACLSLSARAACSGNIQTLLEYSNPPTSIPESFCYSFMFSDCTNLITAPALPATTLAEECYAGMFYGCTSLTQAPALPATTLADGCYRGMFEGCTSLKISSTKSPEYPTPWRIPSSGTISSTASDWNLGMLSGTGGTFTDNPYINTTYYGAWTK